jgi:hypothetical protein
MGFGADVILGGVVSHSKLPFFNELSLSSREAAGGGGGGAAAAVPLMRDAWESLCQEEAVKRATFAAAPPKVHFRTPAGICAGGARRGEVEPTEGTCGGRKSPTPQAQAAARRGARCAR